MAWEQAYTVECITELIPSHVPTASTSKFDHRLRMWFATDGLRPLNVKGCRVVCWEGVRSVGIS